MSNSGATESALDWARWERFCEEIFRGGACFPRLGEEISLKIRIVRASRLHLRPMDTTHGPRTCKWSTPTLLTPWPIWIDTGRWNGRARATAVRAARALGVLSECPAGEALQTTVESPWSKVESEFD